MEDIVSETIKCKILFVIDNIEFGGGERGFAQLINGLPEDRYEISVACLPGGLFEEKIEKNKAKVIPLDLRNRFNPGNILRLANIVKREGVDIIHSQGSRADFYSRIVAKLATVPVLISTIQMPVEGYDVTPLKRLIYVVLDRFSERFVDEFIVVSEKLRKILIYKHKINPEKVITIYNGIEVDEYKPNVEEFRSQESQVRMEFALARDVPVIGAIGRLVWQKGFEYLIEAVPEVSKEYPDAKFLIVGEGPLKSKLKVKSEKLRVEDKVIFTGFRTDIKDILSAIDILVIPSLLEGFPMITLEAMAMEKPIIATNIDGITEQITDGTNGILIPPKDPSAIAQAIIRLINDRESGRKLGLAARKKVEQEFSVEKMVSKIEKVYLSLLKTN
jgi:glycosyltransferase involved in cell wall biosynthesis